MRGHRVRVRGAMFAAISVLGVLAVPTVTSAVEATVVHDGGFEAAVGPGSALDSPEWVEADSAYGSPLCSLSVCSNPDGPRTGNVWAWFGGGAVVGQTASLTQTITMPSGSGIDLEFWYWRRSVASPYDATLAVLLDGDAVRTLAEPETADAGWVQASVDVSDYADGEPHELRFAYANPSGGSNSVYLDDVSVVLPARVAAPTITSPDPLTGHWSNSSPSVTIAGTSVAGSTVEFYNHDSSCTGTPIGTGTAEEFAAGIAVEVPPNSSNFIYVRAVKDGLLSSHCGSDIVSFVHDTIAPVAPTQLGVSPSSPGASTTPVVSGTLPQTGTIRLYATPDCSGAPVATGTDNAFADPGFTVAVAKGSTTTWHADAVDRAGNESVCSTDSVTYTQLDPPPPPPAIPDTTFTRTPAKKVVTTKRRVKVTFAFTSSLPGSVFTCVVDGGAPRPCSSPFSFKAKVGKHTVKVTGSKAGAADPTPASYTFKVKRPRK